MRPAVGDGGDRLQTGMARALVRLVEHQLVMAELPVPRPSPGLEDAPPLGRAFVRGGMMGLQITRLRQMATMGGAGFGRRCEDAQGEQGGEDGACHTPADQPVAHVHTLGSLCRARHGQACGIW